MTKTTTTIWEPASHLSTEEDVAAYLEAALQDGDPQLVDRKSTRLNSSHRT